MLFTYADHSVCPSSLSDQIEEGDQQLQQVTVARSAAMAAQVRSWTHSWRWTPSASSPPAPSQGWTWGASFQEACRCWRHTARNSPPSSTSATSHRAATASIILISSKLHEELFRRTVADNGSWQFAIASRCSCIGVCDLACYVVCSCLLCLTMSLLFGLLMEN